MQYQEKIIHRALRWAKAAGMNQVQFAQVLGVQPQHVTNWKKRGDRDLPAEYWIAVADHFGRSIDELVGRVPELPLRLNTDYSLLRVRVIGTTTTDQEGHWTQLQQHPVGTGQGYVNVPSRDRKAYAIRIIGDTTHSRVRSGEYVVIEPSHPLIPGEEVLIITKDGISMIRDFLYQRDGHVGLQNNKGDRLTLPEAEIAALHYIAAIAKHSLYSEDGPPAAN